MDETNQPPSPWVLTTSSQTFGPDVVERSKQTPVVVDFWATWCAPCRQLGPILESLAQEYAGRFVLAKADMDRMPDVAMQFGVQAVPTVFAVANATVIDMFAGALPEPQIRAWLDRVLLSVELEQTPSHEQDDPVHAEATYRRIIEQAPDEARAVIGLARVLLATGRQDEARQLIDRLEKRGFLEPEAEKVKAALAFADRPPADVDTRRAAAATQPDNLQLQLQLAEALAAEKHFGEALQICLALVEQDRTGAGEPARRLMVDIFRVLPAESELVRDYRRQLSMALY